MCDNVLKKIEYALYVLKDIRNLEESIGNLVAYYYVVHVALPNFIIFVFGYDVYKC